MMLRDIEHLIEDAKSTLTDAQRRFWYRDIESLEYANDLLVEALRTLHRAQDKLLDFIAEQREWTA